MNSKERRKNCPTFIKSKKFGLDTWTTLYLFNVNMQDFERTIKIYWNLIPKIQQNDSLIDADERTRLRISQLVALDMISKTMVLIESTLVLIDALSKGYKHVAKSLAYYDANLPRSIIKKMSKKNPKDYNFRKILGLCEISKLPISIDEKKLLGKKYQETFQIMKNCIHNLASFYDEYRIIYGKSKHGLMIQSGGNVGDASTLDFKKSFLSVIDHKKKHDLPKGYFSIPKTDELTKGWFNTKSFVKFNDKFIDEIDVVLKDLFVLVSYVTHNHLTYADNCGEYYIPYVKSNKTTGTMSFYGNPLTSEEYVLGDSIQSKIFPQMNFSPRELRINGEIKVPEAAKSFRTDSVTTSFFEESI